MLFIPLPISVAGAGGGVGAGMLILSAAFADERRLFLHLCKSAASADMQLAEQTALLVQLFGLIAARAHKERTEEFRTLTPALSRPTGEGELYPVSLRSVRSFAAEYFRVVRVFRG